MNDLLVLTVGDLACWSVLVAFMTVGVAYVVWAWHQFSNLAPPADPPSLPRRPVDVEDMPGHPERVTMLSDPARERTFGAIVDRLLRDEDLAAVLDEIGWHE